MHEPIKDEQSLSEQWRQNFMLAAATVAVLEDHIKHKYGPEAFAIAQTSVKMYREEALTRVDANLDEVIKKYS